MLSLCATACILWFTRYRPRLRHITLEALIGQALGFSLLVWFWAAAIALALFLTIPRRDRRDSIAAALRTSATAVWFAPAILLVSGLSPAAIAAALVLVVSASRLLYSEWLLIHPPEPAFAVPRGMFGCDELPPTPFVRVLAPSFGLALCIQSGLVALLLNMRLPAAFLLVMGAALLTMSAISRGVLTTDPTPGVPRAIFGVCITVLLSAGLTVGGLSHRVLRGGGSDDGDWPGGGPTAEVKPPTAEAPVPSALAVPGDYPGVILWPEAQRHTTLVAPTPPDFGGATSPGTRSYRIPFAGEYWMFRWPYRRPPPHSSIQTGNPATLSFATTDHYPLQMEAHQRLYQPFDPHCCRKVKLELWNADRYPGTVTLYLYAIDSETPHSIIEPWGSAPILSVPDLKSEPVRPVRGTLEYSIPPESRLTTVTEFQLIFARARTRQDKSARISIDAFILSR